MTSKMYWACLGLALVCGAIISWIDMRPTWDDTGITAGAILFVTFLLGMAVPEYAWMWAMAVGGGIPIVEMALRHNYASIAALILAFSGAYAGARARIALSATRPH